MGSAKAGKGPERRRDKNNHRRLDSDLSFQILAYCTVYRILNPLQCNDVACSLILDELISELSQVKHGSYWPKVTPAGHHFQQLTYSGKRCSICLARGRGIPGGGGCQPNFWITRFANYGETDLVVQLLGFLRSQTQIPEALGHAQSQLLTNRFTVCNLKGLGLRLSGKISLYGYSKHAVCLVLPR